MSEKISQIENYFYNNKKNLIHKWDHYFEIYDRHFKKYKDKDVVLVRSWCLERRQPPNVV